MDGEAVAARADAWRSGGRHKVGAGAAWWPWAADTVEARYRARSPSTKDHTMTQTKIGVIVGSLRKDSLNKKLATGLAKLAPADFSFEQLRIDDLPLYNQDDDGQQAASVLRLKSEIVGAQGLLFVTPEYNRSVPGVLKNAIDHASRPYGQSAFAGKPAGVIGASVGAIGTALAQQHLRNVLAYLDVPTLGQPEAFVHAKEGLFDADGSIGESSRKFLQGWMDRYVAWVRSHQA
jgi:chromate reductase